MITMNMINNVKKEYREKLEDKNLIIKTVHRTFRQNNLLYNK